MSTTKGRKKTAAPVAEMPAIDHDDVARGEQALERLAGQQQTAQDDALALAGQFGYDGALTVGGLEEEIRFYQRRSVEAVLELGKRLMLLKTVTAHGGFTESLERLGIGHTMAKRFMTATAKFSKSASTHLLALPNLSQTKLLELLVLDDAEIEALDQGESARGLKLDDIDCMSVSELRRALRVAAAEQAAALADKDAVIVQKTAKIEELVEAKNRREVMTDAEQQAELERDLAEATLVAVGELQVMRKRIDDIRALDHLPQGLYVACAHALQRMVSEAMSIADDYGIELMLAAEELIGDPNVGEDAGADWLEPRA